MFWRWKKIRWESIFSPNVKLHLHSRPLPKLFDASIYYNMKRDVYELGGNGNETSICYTRQFQKTPLSKYSLKVLASVPCFYFLIWCFSLLLSHAAYNVVKDLSGNASRPVTKYSYTKHISRSCNLPPPKKKILG